MHPSSLENMQFCYEKYIKSRAWPDRHEISVYDIGGANVNGNYSDIFSENPFKYISVDIDPSANVDIVLEDPYKLPFDDNSLDIIISGQVFEHAEFFWLLFAECIRALKPDGMLILIAPSAGPIHRYPVDCYRFYPDSYKALAKYAGCELLFLKHDRRGPWNDLVGVFSKNQFNDSAFTIKNDWALNRFEKTLQPAETGIPPHDQNIDVLKGQMPYIDILERLHSCINPNIYLEIGVRNGDTLRLAGKKAYGVDPLPSINVALSSNHNVIASTSDDFFHFDSKNVFGNEKIDFAFIDGLHLFEFVLRDFINIEKYSHPKSVVVIDDIYPNHPVQAERIRKSSAWTGDVWKIFYCLQQWRKDLGLVLFDSYPTGLLMVTGLNSNNRILEDNYNDIVHHFKNAGMSQIVKTEIFNRTKAISPIDTQIFSRLSDFVKK